MKIITGPLAALKLAQIVAYDASLNDAAKRVFSILAGYADAEGCCYPSITKIAACLGLSRQAIINQINILIQHGYVSRYSRYLPETGRRTSNLYQLNFELANMHQKTPEVFCRRNVTLVVTYIVTLLRYGGMSSQEVADHVSQWSDINITAIKYQSEHKKKEHTAGLINRKKVYANAWQSEKERERVTGVSVEHQKMIENLTSQLRQHLTSMQIAQNDIEMRQKIKELKLSPLKAAEYIIKNLQDTVTQYSYIKT